MGRRLNRHGVRDASRSEVSSDVIHPSPGNRHPAAEEVASAANLRVIQGSCAETDGQIEGIQRIRSGAGRGEWLDGNDETPVDRPTRLKLTNDVTVDASWVDVKPQTTRFSEPAVSQDALSEKCREFDRLIDQAIVAYDQRQKTQAVCTNEKRSDVCEPEFVISGPPLDELVDHVAEEAKQFFESKVVSKVKEATRARGDEEDTRSIAQWAQPEFVSNDIARKESKTSTEVAAMAGGESDYPYTPSVDAEESPAPATEQNRTGIGMGIKAPSAESNSRVTVVQDKSQSATVGAVAAQVVEMRTMQPKFHTASGQVTKLPSAEALKRARVVLEQDEQAGEATTSSAMANSSSAASSSSIMGFRTGNGGSIKAPSAEALKRARMVLEHDEQGGEATTSSTMENCSSAMGSSSSAAPSSSFTGFRNGNGGGIKAPSAEALKRARVVLEHDKQAGEATSSFTTGNVSSAAPSSSFTGFRTGNGGSIKAPSAEALKRARVVLEHDEQGGEATASSTMENCSSALGSSSSAAPSSSFTGFRTGNGGGIKAPSAEALKRARVVLEHDEQAGEATTSSTTVNISSAAPSRSFTGFRTGNGGNINAPSAEALKRARVVLEHDEQGGEATASSTMENCSSALGSSSSAAPRSSFTGFRTGNGGGIKAPSAEALKRARMVLEHDEQGGEATTSSTMGKGSSAMGNGSSVLGSSSSVVPSRSFKGFRTGNGGGIKAPSAEALKRARVVLEQDAYGGEPTTSSAKGDGSSAASTSNSSFTGFRTGNGGGIKAPSAEARKRARMVLEQDKEDGSLTASPQQQITSIQTSNGREFEALAVDVGTDEDDLDQLMLGMDVPSVAFVGVETSGRNEANGGHGQDNFDQPINADVMQATVDQVVSPAILQQQDIIPETDQGKAPQNRGATAEVIETPCEGNLLPTKFDDVDTRSETGVQSPARNLSVIASDVSRLPITTPEATSGMAPHWVSTKRHGQTQTPASPEKRNVIDDQRRMDVERDSTEKSETPLAATTARSPLDTFQVSNDVQVSSEGDTIDVARRLFQSPGPNNATFRSPHVAQRADGDKTKRSCAETSSAQRANEAGDSRASSGNFVVPSMRPSPYRRRRLPTSGNSEVNRHGETTLGSERVQHSPMAKDYVTPTRRPHHGRQALTNPTYSITTPIRPPETRNPSNSAPETSLSGRLPDRETVVNRSNETLDESMSRVPAMVKSTPLRLLPDGESRFIIRTVSNIHDDYDTPLEALGMSLESAERYEFSRSDVGTNLTTLDTDTLRIGWRQLAEKLNEGVKQSLHATDLWVKNHYALIVWKLACYERSFPTQCRGFLTASRVLRQLELRWYRETIDCERSFIKALCEGDQSAARHVVLCVCSAKVNLPDQRASSVSVLVTDGWYTIRAELDEELASLYRNGLLPIGEKLRCVLSEYHCDKGPTSPLSLAPADASIKLFRNCTWRAPWHARMGLTSRRPLKRVAKLTSGGGTVPMIHVKLIEKLPDLFVVNDKGMRLKISAQREADMRRANEDCAERKQQGMIEVLTAAWELSQSIHDAAFNRVGARNANGSKLSEVLQADDPSKVWKGLTSKAKMAIACHCRKVGMDDLRQSMQAEMPEPFRAVPLLRFIVEDASANGRQLQGTNAAATAELVVEVSEEDHSTHSRTLHCGNEVRVTHLKAFGKTGDERLALYTGRQSRITGVEAASAASTEGGTTSGRDVISESPAPPLKFSDISSDLVEGNKVSVVGCVIYVQMLQPQKAHDLHSVVFLCDETQTAIAIETRDLQMLPTHRIRQGDVLCITDLCKPGGLPMIETLCALHVTEHVRCLTARHVDFAATGSSSRPSSHVFKAHGDENEAFVDLKERAAKLADWLETEPSHFKRMQSIAISLLGGRPGGV